MSISKTRNFIEKSGCGLAVGIVLVLVLALTFVFQGGPAMQQDDPASRGVPIAKIGDYSITDFEIASAVEQRQRSYQTAVPPIQEAFDTAEALSESVRRGLTYHLAKQKGINPSDEQIIDSIKGQIMSDVRMQLMSTGALPFDADENKFREAYRKQTGQDFDEAIEKDLANIRERMEIPQVRATLAASAAGPLLHTAIQNSLNPTDEEVRKAQGTLVTKSILFKADPNAQKQAEDVLKQIKGGLSFETAMDRYSTVTPPKMQRKSQVTENLPAFTVMTTDAYTSLREMKPGTVSDVIPTFEGPKIYKIVSFKEMPKAEYEKGKANFKQQYVSTMAATELSKQLDAAADKIQWESDGYRLMHEYTTVVRDRELSQAEKSAKIQAIHKQAKEVEASDDIGQNVAALVRYATLEDMWREATATEKTALRDERIEVLKAAFERAPDITLAFELSDLLAEKKEKEAGTFLALAAESNQDFEPQNQGYFTQIASKLQKLKGQGLITPEDEERVKQEQARWREGKLAYDKDLAEQKELERKEAEEAKRLEAEEKKKQAEAEKAKKTPPAPGNNAAPKKPATTGG